MTNCVPHYQKEAEKAGWMSTEKENIPNREGILASKDPAIMEDTLMFSDHSDDPKTWYDQGIALRDQNQITDALACFEKAIALRPEYADAWQGRGNALRRLDRASEAIEAYDRAIAIKPDHAVAWQGRGYALRKLGRCDEATDSFTRALAIEPDSGDVWYYRGNLLLNLERYEEAVDALDKALVFRPEYANAWYTGASRLACSVSMQKRSIRLTGHLLSGPMTP